MRHELESLMAAHEQGEAHAHYPTLSKNSDDFKKLDSKTIEFNVSVPPDGEKTVNYKVHYSW